jgi:glyoxalase family protein
MLGLHHVTALAGNAQQNLDYYRGVRGMRLVKRTVNYDDPASHHFYYADPNATPGAILTFFPWGHVRKPHRGIGQASSVAFEASKVQATGDRLGHPVESVLNPDGLTLEFIEVPNARPNRLHSVTLCVEELKGAGKFLVDVLGLAAVDRDEQRWRFRVGGDQFVDLIADQAAGPGKMGAGVIHHVAFRIGTEEKLLEWRNHLVAAGLRVTPVKDRTYFHSIYFRGPDNVLFELATDLPGFAIDEPPESLGQRLCLPPWLEQHRSEVESRLSPIRL